MQKHYHVKKREIQQLLVETVTSPGMVTPRLVVLEQTSQLLVTQEQVQLIQ